MSEITYCYGDCYGDKLLIKIYYGEIYFRDVTESWDRIIEEGFIRPHTKGVLNDYRIGILRFTVNDVEKLMNYFTQKGVFDKFRFALLMDTPDQVVFPTLAGTFKTGFRTAPFTTKEAAINWILCGDRQ
jgi:hypothetical protein